MNKQTSQILSIVVLSVLAIILIVSILKKNNTEGFQNVPYSDIVYQKYGFQDPERPFNISQLDFATIAGRVNTRSNRFPGSGTLSWENESVLKNPRLMPIFNLFYGRSCPPPLISKMGGYAVYKEQNDMLPVEER